MLSVFVSSRLGREGGLLLNNVVVTVGAALMGLEKYAGSYQMLIAGRLWDAQLCAERWPGSHVFIRDITNCMERSVIT